MRKVTFKFMKLIMGFVAFYVVVSTKNPRCLESRKIHSLQWNMNIIHVFFLQWSMHWMILSQQGDKSISCHTEGCLLSVIVKKQSFSKINKPSPNWSSQIEISTGAAALYMLTVIHYTYTRWCQPGLIMEVKMLKLILQMCSI